MWLLVLMSGVWYAQDFVDEDGLRDDGGLDNMFQHIENGNVVSLVDDLDTWCDEMDVHIDKVVKL